MFAVGAMFIGLIAVTPLFGALNYDSVFFVFFLLFGMLWSGYSYSVPSRPPRSRDSGRPVDVLLADR